MQLDFEWDGAKALANIRKHRVTFEEVSSVFGDPLALIFNDKAHSEYEHREILIGHSFKQRLLLVSFTETEKGTVRIISARRATMRERMDYEEYQGI